MEGVGRMWEISKEASFSQDFSICVFLKKQRQDSIKKNRTASSWPTRSNQDFDWKLCDLTYLYN